MSISAWPFDHVAERGYDDETQQDAVDRSGIACAGFSVLGQHEADPAAGGHGGSGRAAWWFLRFLGVAEVTGALGLILPGLFGIRTDLTPLAASGLVIIMIGATTITAFAMAVAPALVPMAIGLLAAFVGSGRWRPVPVSAASRRPMLVTVS
jgi:hypothetical protein